LFHCAYFFKRRHVRIFFVNSPGNPYGRIIPQKVIESLINICNRHKCYLIFDAVYKELYFENPPYIPIEHLNPNLFYVNSFSKLFSITGWRVGYIISDVRHMSAIRQLHDYTGLCAPSVLQAAIAEYIIMDLKKYGYTPKWKEKAGFRKVKIE
jgi:aspartate/methionine/tyrosine aminotransferase